MGCLEIAVSIVGVFPLWIMSGNGCSAFKRRSAPVPHIRKFSATVRAEIGFLNSIHGSYAPRGVTQTSANSCSANFGLSPPRKPRYNRITAPLTSYPASDMPTWTRCCSIDVPAIKICAPGTRTGIKVSPNSRKYIRTCSRSCGERVVKRGRGSRLLPPMVGGSRHTPPRPLRNFAISCGKNSTIPKGGSVQTA